MENPSNPRKMWQITKKKLFGTKYCGINKIMENNKFTQGSNQVANVLNQYFTRKSVNIVNSLTKKQKGPHRFLESPYKEKY